MALGEYLATDDLTVLLGLVSITVFLLHNLYKPQALVHPILLGRQSDVGRVRKAGESAVYRNYATGLMGRVRCANSMLSRVLMLMLCSSWRGQTRTSPSSGTLSSLNSTRHARCGRQRYVAVGML